MYIYSGIYIYMYIYVYIYVYIFTSGSKIWVNKNKIALKINLNELIARGVRYILGGAALWGLTCLQVAVEEKVVKKGL